MRVAMVSDEPFAVHAAVREELVRRGHEIVAFGAIATGQEGPWAPAAEEAARAVASGDCGAGVFFCWTGTGISIAANKIRGVRAALCTDRPTAEGARVWNHANVLCLSNRQLALPGGEALALDLLSAWLDTEQTARGDAGVALLTEVERRSFEDLADRVTG
jgi:ribose 5-phosphate isomerase B